MRSFFLLLLVAVLSGFGNIRAQETCPVIPLPNQYEATGQTFKLNKETAVIIKDSSFIPEAYYFKTHLLHYTGIALAKKNSTINKIILQKGYTGSSKAGSYKINMATQTITITAKNKEGIFNGLITLLQLALNTKGINHNLSLQCFNIADEPLYSWRGFMLDESRHFFGKKTIKEVLDQMALLKLNRFHWHLTDEPGWRIQIKGYPKLALIGGIGNKSNPEAPAQYYTQQDIKEIVDYARVRHIQVVPEIDMPGHATAANRAYPQYSGGGTGKYANFTFNPGKAGTYQYLTNILGEVATLFPFGMIHLGGDEVSFGSKSWNKDTAVQLLMQKHHLQNLKDVEHYFFQRMTDSALQYFGKVLAWDEAVDADMPVGNTIIFWWRHNKPKQLQKALAKGFHVVLCPRIPLYFDFVQDSTHLQGRRWAGHFSSVKQVYNFTNQTYPIQAKNNDLILGIQGNLWTEKVTSKRRLEFMIFPRIAALSEAAWTTSDNRNYKNFLHRLQTQFSLYENAGLYYFNPSAPAKTPEAIDLNVQ